MPPSGARWSCDVVHEVADQEDAAAAALQQVLRRQRVGDILGVEPSPWSRTRIDQLGHAVERRSSNSTKTRLRVVLVAVLDGVDDALADGDADPVHGVLVEADVRG